MNEKICIICTSSFTVNVFLVPLINKLSEYYQVSVIVNNHSKEQITSAISDKVKIIHLSLERKVSLLKDFYCLIALLIIFKKNNYRLIHSYTPKAGLLAMIAGKVIGITVRCHTFTGQVWSTKTGIKRELLKFTDRLIEFCATKLYADSSSQIGFLYSEKIGIYKKINLIAKGSICGVDKKRFFPNKYLRNQTRKMYENNENDFIYLFLGRINKDKGVCDLLEAFNLVSSNNNVYLWIAGPIEDVDTYNEIKDKQLRNNKIKLIEKTNAPENLMRAADIFLLASKREGFGMVLIEAASCGTPSIAYNINGVVNAIKHEHTGLLVDPENIKGLSEAMERVLGDPGLIKKFSENGLARVDLNYNQEFVLNFYLSEYKKICK